MKKRLTLEIFGTIILVISLIFIMCIISNVISLKCEFAFSDDFYNLNFSSSDVMNSYIDEIEIDNGKITINNLEKLNKLKESGTWIQILDNENKEIYNFNKNPGIPTTYTVGEFMKYSNEWWTIGNSTLFSMPFKLENANYTFVLGAPQNKIMTKRYSYTLEWFLLNVCKYVIGIIIIIIVAYLLSVRLSMPISELIEKIKWLADGKFLNKKSSGYGLYASLEENIYTLSERLRVAEEERSLIEKSRNEWISNVAHDLKTPLASIQGYAEMLKSENYNITKLDRIEYSGIIVSKVDYILELIEDLKLTYQLKTKEIPLKIKEENIVDVIRECVIDILNTPKYENREITFETCSDNIIVLIDSHYIKRAINNLIYNALVHNPEETIINIKIENKNGICITINDNGNGMSEEELKNIFKRYYRGTNTGEKHKGSGLGMAISKEIIEANNGSVEIYSEIGKGTRIKIIWGCRPIRN